MAVLETHYLLVGSFGHLFVGPVVDLRSDRPVPVVSPVECLHHRVVLNFVQPAAYQVFLVVGHH